MSNTTTPFVEIITPTSKVKILYRHILDKDLLGDLEGKTFLELRNPRVQFTDLAQQVTDLNIQNVCFYTCICHNHRAVENNKRTVKLWFSDDGFILTYPGLLESTIPNEECRDNRIFLVTEITITEGENTPHSYVYGNTP